MGRLSDYIEPSFAEIEGVQQEELYKAQRTAQVRSMWANVVENHFLQHTNGVYILEENGVKTLHVYVDESIYAAELNNRRELIQLLYLEKFGEKLDQFNIYISRGLMKKRYPYREQHIIKADQHPALPLSSSEIAEVKKSCESIKNREVREHFEKAMIADLEWKKGNP